MAKRLGPREKWGSSLAASAKDDDWDTADPDTSQDGWEKWDLTADHAGRCEVWDLWSAFDRDAPPDGNWTHWWLAWTDNYRR